MRDRMRPCGVLPVCTRAVLDQDMPCVHARLDPDQTQSCNPENSRFSYCLEELCCNQQCVRQSGEVGHPCWNFECQIMSRLEIMQPAQREIDEYEQQNGQGRADAQQRVKWKNEGR